MSILNQPWPYLATAAFIAIMGIYAWKQPHRPGARYFGCLVGVWFIGVLSAVLDTVLRIPQLQYWLWMLKVISVLLIPTMGVMFVLEYTGSDKWLARRGLVVLALPTLIFGLAAIILPSSALVSVNTNTGVEVVLAREPVRWFLYGTNLGIWLIGVWVLVGCLLRAPAFRAPILLMILGTLIPELGFLLFGSRLNTVPPIRLAILFTNFTALAFTIALFGFRILWVVPVARDKAIDNMPYGMLILDAENFLADFNPAAQKLPGLPGKLVLRQAASVALGDWWERIAPLIGLEPALQDTVILTSDGQQHFQVYSQPIQQANGWRVGQVLLLEDVTQARQAQQRQVQTLWAQATFQEREQLATELHDGLSQSLAFLNLQAQTALIHIQEGESEAAQDCLVRLTDAAYEIQENTRELIGHLLAVSKPMHNFRTALRQVLAEFQEQTGIRIYLEMNGDGDASTSIDSRLDTEHLPPAVAVQLVRIIQEALANVRKHARQASRVTVQLKTGNEQVSLAIMDDGAGFDMAELQNHGNHFGLQVIRQRATRIGGQVSISSEPGKGTRIEVNAPLLDGETRSKG